MINWKKCNCEHCMHSTVCKHSADVQYLIMTILNEAPLNIEEILSINIGCKYYDSIDKDEKSINPYQE